MIPDDKLMIQRDKERKMKDNLEAVKIESQTYTRLVNQLIREHSEDLDGFIDDVDKLVRDLKRGKVRQYSELKLEMKCLTLAHAMYKAADGLSILGGQSDVAKIMREEAFSRAYSKVTDGTIPDKKAEADRLAIEEQKKKELESTITVKGIRTIWDFEILNENEVPREFCSLNSKKIKKSIKNGLREIKGIRIFSKQDVR